MRELYFNNIPGIGKLYFLYSLFEFECEPVLFICNDDYDKRYLCLCSDFRYSLRYLISDCGEGVLSQLEQCRISIRDAILKAPKIIIVDVVSNEERIEIAQSKDINTEDLPKQGLFVYTKRKN